MKTALDLLNRDLARSQAVSSELSRTSSAAPVVAKGRGSPWPFDRVDIGSASAAEKLTHPYEQSTWIMRAIQLKAGEITAVPVKWYDGDEEYTSDDFAAWWAKPFLGPGKQRIPLQEARQMLAGWLDLEGEYFVVLGDDWMVPFPEIRGTRLSLPLIARPDKMRHIVRGGELVGWELTDGAGMRHVLLPEQVIHRKLWNPYDDFRGLAPVKAVMDAAEGDYLAGVYVRNLMRNNGDQGVYVIAKNGVPTDDQREQIVTQLRDKRRAALRGDFRPVFLTGDIAVEDAKAQAPDANLNQTRLHSRHEIFIGLGVPASMADIKASYSVGAASDRYQLITGTCMALANMVDEPLGEIATRLTGVTLRAEADWDEHPVMAEVRHARVETALKLWGTGQPMESINDYLDLGMEEYPGWDVGYLPFSVVPAGSADLDAIEPTNDPALAEPEDPMLPEDEATKAIRLALLARKRVKAKAAARSCRRIEPGDTFAAFRCECGAGEGEMVDAKARDPKEVARWRELMAKRREIIRGYQSRINRELFAARSEVLRKIEANYRPQKSVDRTVAKAAAGDFIFDLKAFRDRFLAAMRKQAANALDTAGQQLFAELGRDDPFAFPPEAVLEYARRRENKLSGASDAVHGRITETLEEGIVAGDTTEQLAARVRQAFNEISHARSRTIAMTETSAAYGQGRQEAMRSAGIQYKRWLTSGNANVRASHAATNGQTVPIDEAFEVPPGSGVYLTHPGDPSGPPEEVINCHCVSIPVASEDAP